MRIAPLIPLLVGALAVGACDGLVAVHTEPTTQPQCPPGVFCTSVRNQAIDKIDLLFDIDNSASMGDKQAYLRQAIPDLVGRLVQPSCVDSSHPTTVVGRTDSLGNCAIGKPEFPPVHNLHVGIVTSSLGSRLGDVCNANDKTAGGLLKHNDDQGRLINRATDAESVLPDMQPSNFLAWFPDVPANTGRSPGAGAVPQKDLAVFEKDFADLVAGVGEKGCGIESQLESWYRFLVQPDPYDHLDNPGGRATWVDVDATILAQRHDFLRPDSLVAIIVLSDENDSEIDVRALGQQGWNWMSSGFRPPKGTTACNSSPADPGCTSCLLAPNKGAGDPNCATAYTAENDWGFNMNLRHVHMKQKYGVDVQFPIQRYVNGLQSTAVPNRDGEYPPGKANYVGTNNCVNPLFAAQLPDGSNLDFNEKTGALCKLPPGSRTKDLVFYAHVGGVPHELLHFTPNDPRASELTDDDWVKILGRDPQKYDYTGIDAHMIESFSPRAGLPPPPAADNADPIHGREWVTNANANFVDLQYACTFPLARPRDCSLPENAEICDCPALAGAPHDQVPPVCSATTVTQQIRAKAYPTIRETLLARLMGSQGIVSSICPIHVTDNAATDDPLYGYRPAVSAIVDRLKNALANQCLPQPLAVDAQGNVPCVILEVLPDATSTCDARRGLSDPPADVLAKFKESIRTGQPGDPWLDTICQVKQLTGDDLVGGSCAQSTKAGWCYVTGAAAGTCPQAILFSPTGSPVNGATISLQCTQNAGALGR